MTIVTNTIQSAKGDETILSGRNGVITKMTSLNVTKSSGVYTFSLIMVRGDVETYLFTQILSEGDYIEVDTHYILDQSSSLKISSTAGIDLTIIAEVQ